MHSFTIIKSWDCYLFTASIIRKNTYHSSVFLTGLKRKRTFTSSPAILTNLITQEKLIQLLNTAKTNQTKKELKIKPPTMKFYQNKQAFPSLIIMLSKPPLRVISQDQLGIQLRGTSILTKLPKNDGLPGPGTFSAKTRIVSGKPGTICHPLNAARFFCTFFFSNYVSCQRQ